jgi:leucyl-tRNA synthetase
LKEIDMKQMTQYCRQMRRKPTHAELHLKKELQRKGIRFRSQRPIDYYIVDFLIFMKAIVIEVDGGYHFTPDQKIKDEARQKYIESKGFEVIRVTNTQVFTNDLEYMYKRIRTKPDINYKEMVTKNVYGKANH